MTLCLGWVAATASRAVDPTLPLTLCLFPPLQVFGRTNELTLCNRTLIFTNGGGSARIAQTLQNLSGKYVLSFRYGSVSAQGLGAGFSCQITPKIGNDMLQYVDVYETTSNWDSTTQEWSAGNGDVAEAELSLSADCSGEYDQLFIHVDEVTLTKVCDGSTTD